MNETQQLPSGREPVLRIQPRPADVNMHGDIFGGWIMAQVDMAGGIAAAKRARGRVATVAVKEFVFKHPVFVGDVLSFYAEVVRMGNTSVTVQVEVFAERGIPNTQIYRVTEATLTFVAVGEDRKPRPVPAA
ncbi:MAG: acyl-CoA thioesterase [Betaproteobacteria bacterium]|nr:acyl-CoA thioesterase [Betaproteobacteria bacterium]MDE2123607.1 acyl-CoA thioesterase [Betaproteobacteria bacterium]MDE2186159.1 acyl-CoA thioesterase [Betaproteobacteria bacterium]MDE2323156.1 acyl-CoA thioesterase [Betaproteobacteria bacterium]